MSSSKRETDLNQPTLQPLKRAKRDPDPKKDSDTIEAEDIQVSRTIFPSSRDRSHALKQHLLAIHALMVLHLHLVQISLTRRSRVKLAKRMQKGSVYLYYYQRNTFSSFSLRYPSRTTSTSAMGKETRVRVAKRTETVLVYLYCYQLTLPLSFTNTCFQDDISTVQADEGEASETDTDPFDLFVINPKQNSIDLLLTYPSRATSPAKSRNCEQTWMN